MGDINISGTITGVNAIGDNAKAESKQIYIGGELSEVKRQIEILRKELIKTAETTDDYAVIVEVGKAGRAADEGNKSKMLEYLKRGGGKALEVAEKIGVDLVTGLLKSSLGL